MDLSKVKPHTVDLDVTLPDTHHRVGLVLKVQSLNAPKCQEIVKTNREAIQKARDDGLSLEDEKVQDHALNLYAASVVGWTWDEGTDWGGEVLKFNKTNVVKVLKGADFILSQLMDVHGSQKAFFADYAKG